MGSNLGQGHQDDSGIHVTDVKCPACGAPLRLPQGVATFSCDYCGSTIRVSEKTRRTGIEADGSIRDAGSGTGLFVVRAPRAWQVTRASCAPGRSGSRPLEPQADLSDGAGGAIHIRLGDAGTRFDASLKALMASYGQASAGLDTTNYADLPDPVALCDAIATQQAQAMGATGLAFIGLVDTGDAEPLRAEARAMKDRQSAAEGVNLPTGDCFGARLLRTYALSLNGQPHKMAVYVKMLAAQINLGGMLGGMGMGTDVSSLLGAMEGLTSGLGSLFGGNHGQGGTGAALGGASGGATPDGGESLTDFIMGGGLIGRAMRKRKGAVAETQPQAAGQVPQQPQGQQLPQPQAWAQQPQGQQAGQQQQPTQQAPQAPAARWATADPAQWGKHGSYLWSVELVSAFVSPDPSFDERLKGEYLPFVTTVQTHPDLLRLVAGATRQTAAAVQQNSQTILAQSQQAFAAQQAAHQQMQAAYDRQNQAWFDRSNAQHQAFRAASAAQFNTPSHGSGGAGDFSEAIRGVNTFVTSDGREVELSVHSDVAYENKTGDVVGGSTGFDPGADWNQINRA